jgi:TRAP-type uncharacterized transport system fused permease subunit
MLWNQIQQEATSIGWDFYGPVILFVLLIALGVPVWAAIGAGAVTMLYVSDVLPLSLLGESLFDGIDHFALTAVPLFILTGDVLVRTGLSRKFLDVAEALTNWARGGFGSATVLVCGMFSAISGSDAAGAAAVGRMTISRLVESGYPRPYACALVAAGACTGILIPPSIAYIVIGLVLGISASTLFQAALIPGILILVSILVTNIVVNRRHAYEGGGLISMSEWLGNLGTAIRSGWYAFLVPGIIFWGIFSGLHSRHAETIGLPRHFCQFRQGERRHPADHRHVAAAGADHGGTGRPAGLRFRRYVADGESLCPDPVDDRHPDRRRLRDGDDAQHRHPGSDPEAAGR